MKKLSDYRIREFNGKFTVETKIETEEGFFRKRIETRWVNIGSVVFGNLVGQCFDTLEEAKAKIVELCDEPKYHYVVPDYSLKELPNFALGQKRYKVQSVPFMDIPCPFDLSRSDIEYLAKCRAYREKSIKDVYELSELINENKKLINDYVSLYEKHINMIDAYKDLNRKVEELRAMVSAKKRNK